MKDTQAQNGQCQIATTLLSAGMAGAESRHVRMVEKLRDHGFDVKTLTLDITKRVTSSPKKYAPLSLRKLRAGMRTICKYGRTSTYYFAFDPYIFIGAALFARLRGVDAFYFCRNDQIYQKQEIETHTGTKTKNLLRLYLLQIFCLAFCTQYVVQSEFAKIALSHRFPWLRAQRKISVLNNDLHISISPKIPADPHEPMLIGFVANSAWDKKARI